MDTTHVESVGGYSTRVESVGGYSKFYIKCLNQSSAFMQECYDGKMALSAGGVWTAVLSLLLLAAKVCSSPP